MVPIGSETFYFLFVVLFIFPMFMLLCLVDINSTDTGTNIHVYVNRFICILDNRVNVLSMIREEEQACEILIKRMKFQHHELKV